MLGSRVLRSCPSPLKTLNVAPLSFIMECFSGGVGGQPADALHMLPECQNRDSGEVGTSNGFGHCSHSGTMIDILPWE